MRKYAFEKIRDPALKRFLEALLNKIVQKFDPRELWLWGSRIYGNPHHDSDIDLVIISDRFRNIRLLKRRSYFLRTIEFSKYPDLEDIDPFCFTPEEFEKKKQDPWMFKELFEKGVRII